MGLLIGLTGVVSDNYFPEKMSLAQNLMINPFGPLPLRQEKSGAVSGDTFENAGEAKPVRLVEKKSTTRLVHTRKKEIPPETQQMIRRIENTNNPLVIDACCNLTAEQLDKIIYNLVARRGESNIEGNPLIGKGKVFLEMGKKYNVNPLTMIAITMQESGRGSSSAIRNHNNIGGIMKGDKIWHFDSIDESIEKQAKILATRCKEGLNTVDKLGASGKYCATNTGAWTKAVKSFSKEIEKYMKEL